ncbi:hypothetical protein [Streptomyces sp. NPDC002324]
MAAASFATASLAAASFAVAATVAGTGAALGLRRGCIHDDLAQQELLPCEQVVDVGCTPAHIERAARVHGITLLGPAVPDNSRQALLPTRELLEIQTHDRPDQMTEEWQYRYAIRVGIEATLSQNVRAHGSAPLLATAA